MNKIFTDICNMKISSQLKNLENTFLFLVSGLLSGIYSLLIFIARYWGIPYLCIDTTFLKISFLEVKILAEQTWKVHRMSWVGADLIFLSINICLLQKYCEENNFPGLSMSKKGVLNIYYYLHCLLHWDLMSKYRIS